jgi:hypothetical protein
MLQSVINYWYIILICLGFVGYMVYLTVKRRWTSLRELAYELIRQAEQAISGTKMGRERFEFVLTQLYNMIPVWLRFFIPRSLLVEKLQEWFDLIKDSLDDGKINSSIKPMVRR